VMPALEAGAGRIGRRSRTGLRPRWQRMFPAVAASLVLRLSQPGSSCILPWFGAPDDSTARAARAAHPPLERWHRRKRALRLPGSSPESRTLRLRGSSRRPLRVGSSSRHHAAVDARQLLLFSSPLPHGSAARRTAGLSATFVPASHKETS
jgi:hypothetical protein